MNNKYHAIKTYSSLCGRQFDSKREAGRAEELHLLQMAGQIEKLKYQVPFVLSEKPRVTIKIDFGYVQDGKQVYEDSKGVLTRDARTKLAWMKEKFGIDVILS